MGLFNVFSNNEEAKNLSHIKNLIQVAYSDGDLDESELKLIISIANKIDIPKEKVLSMIEDLENIKFTPPSSYEAKVELMADLVKVLLADKKISEDEIKFCKEIANRLKLNAAVVDDLINSLIKSNFA